MVTTYKGATLLKFKGDLKIMEHNHRELDDDEVLVKVMSCTILPADLALLGGLYGSALPSLPRVFGMEGSGVIEKVGKGLDSSLIGKICGVVGVSSTKNFHGTWSEYVYTQRHNLMIFNKEMDFDQIAACQGNPLTACGFIETIKSSGKKSVAQTGSSSAFGKMFMRLCIQEGIEIINVVRKQSNIDDMKKLGGKHFVNTSEKGWEIEFKKLCNELDVSILFDCAGGDITGKCFSGLKQGGILYHFGNLELKRLSNIDPNDFIFGKKRIQGWWLTHWLLSSSKETLDHWRNVIVKDFEENKGEIFSTYFTASFPLREIEKAFECYMTTSGKVLMKPWE